MGNEDEKTAGIPNSFEKFFSKDEQKKEEVTNGRCRIKEICFICLIWRFLESCKLE